MTMKNKKNDPDSEAVYQTSTSITYDQTTGKGSALIRIPSSRSINFPITSLFYDLQVVGQNPADMVETIVEGKFKIKEDITRSV